MRPSCRSLLLRRECGRGRGGTGLRGREAARGGRGRLAAPRGAQPCSGRGLPAPAPPAARRLRPAAAARHRCPPPRGRGRLDRRGEVDPRQLRGRCPGEPAGGAAAHDHLTGSRPPPAGPAVVRRHPDPPRPRPGHRPGHRGVAARHRPARRVHRAARRDGTARRAGHRLRRVGEPGDRDPAALRGRPLALRDHRGPLRRRGAVGPAAHRGGPWHGGRDRPRPHPPGGRGRDPPSPRGHASRAGPAHRSDLHGARDDVGRRRAPSRRGGRPAESLASGAGERLPGSSDRRRPDLAGRGGVTLGSHGGARGGQPRPARRRRRPAAEPSTSPSTTLVGACRTE